MTTHTIIIAEAGVNHNGCLDTALRLVDTAAQAGADYIKFQTFKAEKLVTATAPRAQYQRQALPGQADDSQLRMLRQLELSYQDFDTIAQYCRQQNIGFLSTPFDLDSIRYLATLHMDYWKIPSGEITNLPYLRAIAAQPGDIIMSTGMSTLQEVKDAVHVLTDAGKTTQQISLLHCTTQYPAPIDSVNLRAIDTLRTLHTAAVGYSDHTQGITIPVAAVARGAQIIEKHFTLDHNLPGPDHKASLEPHELARMVAAIRQVEAALGSPDKQLTQAEAANCFIARRSIVAARHIPQGKTITEDDITTKRPASGISPMLWDHVIGTKATGDYNPDDLITL